jgi:hypothetical protein
LSNQISTQQEEHIQEFLVAQKVKLNEEMTRNFTDLIQSEQDELRKIEETIKLFEENLVHQKRQVGGVNAVVENQRQMQTQIQILERRLNRTVQKFNSITTQNVQLRTEIDFLKQERQEFDRWANQSPAQERAADAGEPDHTKGVQRNDRPRGKGL